MRSLVLFNSVSHLSHIRLSTSLSRLPFLCLESDHKFIGGGGMPVEVKRVSGSLSDLPIILYGSSSGRAFITLNYTLRLLPAMQDGPGLIILSSYPGGT